MFNQGGYGFDLGALIGNMLGGRNNNGGDFGGNGAWWVIILLLALGDNGLFGNRRNDGGASGGMTVVSSPAVQGALTRGDLCMDMNFNNLQGAVRNVENGVNSGFANLNSTICNQQYDTARLVTGLENVVQNGFNNSNVVALQNQNALQTLITQCCCDIKSLFAQAEYNRATDTCAITNAINQAAQTIVQNDNANYRQLHDEQIALQIQNKDATIAQLQSALNSCNNQNLVNTAVQQVVNQVRPTPGPAWVVPNPFNTWGCNSYYNSCGGCGNSNIYGAV